MNVYSMNAKFLPKAAGRITLAGLLLWALVACKEHGSWSGVDEDLQGDNSKILSQSAQISQLIPTRVAQRDAWAADIGRIMDELKISKTRENVCSVIAVVDQESNFVANPAVPDLGNKAIKAFQTEVPQKFIKQFGPALGPAVSRYFTYVLLNEPSKENSFLVQMRAVKTEQQLDLIYRQIFAYVAKQFYADSIANAAAKFMGKDFGEENNPITTIGSMQVSVKYARQHQRDHASVNELRDYMYTREGGLYYGIHRLMKYHANYDNTQYRFADYNSGMYSSRNAAFQQSINKLLNLAMSLDGDLLLYDKDDNVQSMPSQTETALNQLFADHGMAMKSEEIRADLLQEKQAEFENTTTYQNVINLYKRQFGKNPPYAIMPQVLISGPKLSKDYNTNWYAANVTRRYDTCMRRAGIGGRHHKR
jgi:hypothetical protein